MHSPGPWTIGDSGRIYDANAQEVADAYRLEDRPLIAAAPDLLDACEQALLAATEPVSMSDMKIEAHRIRALLRTVIAKATE